MNFQINDPEIIFEPITDLELIGKGKCQFFPDYQGRYKYCSEKTLKYLSEVHNISREQIIPELQKSYTNDNPLKCVNVPDLICCGLIYHLDLLDLIHLAPLTVEHFTNLRLMLYLFTVLPTLEPLFENKKKYNPDFLKKIDPRYLRYALYQYQVVGIDIGILTDSEILQTFIDRKIPETYELYNQRNLRLHNLLYLDPTIFDILAEKLYKSHDLYKIVTSTTQSNLEKILLGAKNFYQIREALGIYTPDIYKEDFDPDQYTLDNLIDYIHCTDPSESKISDLYTAIDQKKVSGFLSRYSDFQLIYEICKVFIYYKSRKDLIYKLKLLTENTPRFFIMLEKTRTIAYGSILNYTQYSGRQLEICFGAHKDGFYNSDRSIQFTEFDIRELLESLIFFEEFHQLIKIIKNKLKN